MTTFFTVPNMYFTKSKSTVTKSVTFLDFVTLLICSLGQAGYLFLLSVKFSILFNMHCFSTSLMIINHLVDTFIGFSVT
jgi:hypothetical protein